MVFLESFLETQIQAYSFSPSNNFVNTQGLVFTLFLLKIQCFCFLHPVMTKIPSVLQDSVQMSPSLGSLLSFFQGFFLRPLDPTALPTSSLYKCYLP